MMTTNTPQETVFFDAIQNGRHDEVRQQAGEDQLLLRAKDYTSFGGTALNVAVFRQDRDMVNTLIDLGADPNDRSDWWAGPWNAVQSALTTGQDELAEYLIDSGARVGIHEAAGLSRIDDLKRLLTDQPESIHARGGDGCTPLHFAGSTEVVDVLLTHGADIDARDIDHHSTPAQYLAPFRPLVARHLFARGATADVFSVIVSGDLARLKQMLAADPTVLGQRIDRETFPPGPEQDVDNIMTFTVGGNATPMHAATIAMNLEMIDALLAAGMDVDATGAYDDCTALHMAAWNDSLPVAKHLVAAGADINRRSGKIHNNSPAGWAIVAGSADVFEYLMDQGADRLDHFATDAETSLRGENLQYKCVPMQNYQRIMAKLS